MFHDDTEFSFFLFFVFLVSFSGFGIRIMLALQNEFKNAYSSSIF